LEFIAITTDLWTSRAQQSFATLTGHWLDSNFVKHHRVLLTCRFEGSHSAELISTFLSDIILELELNNKQKVFITDNAANMVSALKMMNQVRFPCFAHTLQLSIKKGFDIPEINTLLEKARKIVGHFNHSTSATDHLASVLLRVNPKSKKRKLKQEVETRWNSTFDMLERLLDMKNSLLITISDLRMESFAFTTQDWDLMQELCTVLRPLKIITNVSQVDHLIEAIHFNVFDVGR